MANKEKRTKRGVGRGATGTRAKKPTRPRRRADTRAQKPAGKKACGKPDGSSGESSKKARDGAREKLVESARQLFLVNGYEATGVADILLEAGVNSGSLYYYFRTKEALLLAVLERYVELLYPCVMDPAFARTDDPIERIFTVLGGYREMLVMTDCRHGCPIGNLALEMSEKSDAVRELIALNFENWRKAIGQCLVDAGERLPEDVDRDALSSFILTVMEGAVMQARAHRSLAPFDAAVAMLRDYVERLTASDS